MMQSIFKLLSRNNGNNLGRWSTQVDLKIKERRADLANIDSCGDEICSNPKKLIDLYNDKYFKGGHQQSLHNSWDLYSYLNSNK